MSKLVRPILTEENFDKTNEKYQRLLKDYINWSNDTNQGVEAEECESDLIDILVNENYNLDGYRITRYLEDKHYFEPDARLVEILDCSYVFDSLKHDLVKNWIKENNLVIPEDVVGKKVDARYGSHEYKAHYINFIRQDTYEVCVDLDPSRKGGYVVPFEAVNFRKS